MGKLGCLETFLACLKPLSPNESAFVALAKELTEEIAKALPGLDVRLDYEAPGKLFPINNRGGAVRFILNFLITSPRIPGFDVKQVHFSFTPYEFLDVAAGAHNKDKFVFHRVNNQGVFEVLQYACSVYSQHLKELEEQ